MASTGCMDITIEGKAGHDSQPHNAIDACVIAAQSIMAIKL